MIYLDYNATSPIRPEVRGAVAPFLEAAFGNASSLHEKGRQARAAVEQVRAEILEALGDPQGELIFTSSGTEADNLALKGVALCFRGGLGLASSSGKNHLIISAVEHHAVLNTAQALKEEGFEVTAVGVDSRGLVDLNALQEAVTERTLLISVMQGNNETGTVQPIQAIGRIARAHGVYFHSDCVQSFGKIPLEVKAMGLDMASLSSHKLGGPKGVGALYVRQGIPLKPLLHGGPHERGLRAGTENVAGIVGFGKAAKMSLRERKDGSLERIRHLRDRLESGLKGRIPDIQVNGDTKNRLPGTSNISFLGCSGETLMMALDLAGICVSTGSACSSGSTEPSHVLVAMGLPESRIEGSIRFSLGWGTTEEEIETCHQEIPGVVEQVRKAQAARVGQ